MAIVRCPACSRRISSLHEICPHCGANVRQGTLGGDQLASRQATKDRYRLQLAQFFTLTAAIIGCGWYWYARFVAAQQDLTGPLILVVGAGLSYAAVRIYMIVRRFRR